MDIGKAASGARRERPITIDRGRALSSRHPGQRRNEAGAARITISIHICSGALYLHTQHKGGRVDARIGQRPQVYVLHRLAGRPLTYVYRTAFTSRWHASLIDL